ncbi:MAG: transposase, partial [Planctomycetes bacterium]|nr:transposase [Planctomycetota bacterium]
MAGRTADEPPGRKERAEGGCREQEIPRSSVRGRAQHALGADPCRESRGTQADPRQRFVEGGVESALERRKQVRPSKLRKLNGAREARLVAIGYSKAPEGRARWTMRMLADQLVLLEVVDSISQETVRRTLNVHCIGSLYEAFPPAEARRLAKRLEIHYTPKHGSWLNVAEIE